MSGWGGSPSAFPPGPGPGFGGPASPQVPRKSNAGLVVTLVGVLVVALGGLVFVLSEDDSDSSEPGAGGGIPAGDGGAAAGEVDGFAAALAQAIDQQDTGTLTDMTCDDAEDSVAEAIDMVELTDGAALVSAEEAGSGEHLVTVGIVVGSDTLSYVATVVEQGDGWCVQDIVEG